MSLSFQLKAIKDWETLCRLPDPEKEGETILNPITQSIIFATMSTGIGTITKKNYIEFWLRVRAADAISMWPGPPTSLTLQDIERHIGLVTNVFGQEARSKWIKRHMDGATREIEYRRNRDAKKAA